MAKILPGKSNPSRQKIMNAQRTNQTANAASGETAARLAYAREQENKAAKEFRISAPKRVTINSNPVPGKTRVGNLAGGRGGAGLGGLFGNKNR